MCCTTDTLLKLTSDICGLRIITKFNFDNAKLCSFLSAHTISARSLKLL